MNIEEYISTGILEAYALGDLSEKERTEVEANLQRYPALREELSRVEENQERLFLEIGIQPRAEVKQELLKKIAEQPKGKIVSLVQEKSSLSMWKYAAAASVAIALVSTFLAYSYWSKWQSAESNLSDLIAQNQQVAKDYNTVNQRLEKIETDLKVINNPSFTRVVMEGTANATGALASVYWNESTQEVFMSIQNMKELSRENQYQLWAIVDGKPVDAGVFDLNLAGLIKMKEIGGVAAAFAVTIEPRGGKPSPSLETMQVVGNVVKG